MEDWKQCNRSIVVYRQTTYRIRLVIVDLRMPTDFLRGDDQFDPWRYHAVVWLHVCACTSSLGFTHTTLVSCAYMPPTYCIQTDSRNGWTTWKKKKGGQYACLFRCSFDARKCIYVTKQWYSDLNICITWRRRVDVVPTSIATAAACWTVYILAYDRTVECKHYLKMHEWTRTYF